MAKAQQPLKLQRFSKGRVFRKIHLNSIVSRAQQARISGDFSSISSSPHGTVSLPLLLSQGKGNQNVNITKSDIFGSGLPSHARIAPGTTAPTDATPSIPAGSQFHLHAADDVAGFRTCDSASHLSDAYSNSLYSLPHLERATSLDDAPPDSDRPVDVSANLPIDTVKSLSLGQHTAEVPVD
ncbi:hypothetical protein PHET_03419 [Paragonimus heterotremus]|uniref:Uncharacterized protein n=1 Tax=Paragonimus heterotremus TaxID=100268 RepID=A0A8J4SQZ7_9TREM|nr:hypothetical protein PHET_03419 [Paragonimus heterotremus]